MEYLNKTFAQTYGQGTYGSLSYQTGTVSSSSSTGSILTNTGFDILLALTVACVIIFTAIIVNFYRRPKKSQTSS
jgi:sugar phosphate permease